MRVSSGAILTPDQRLRVFVSSTLGELAEERAAVRRAIESLGLTAVMFELGARPHPPRSLYQAYLEQSHVFVGIYWQRYGWVAPRMEISGLEDEYALSAELPRLVYVKEPAPDREPGLSRLVERIEREAAASYARFETAAELEALVRDDLMTLLTERFDAARPGVSIRVVPPAPTTPLVDRSEELAAVTDVLSAGNARLVTVTGPGGVGKTRLAVEVASRVREAFPDGVFFVPLELVDDPASVATAIVRALDLRPAGAARLMGAAARLREAIEAPPAPGARARNDENARVLQRILGDDGFRRGSAEGRALSLDQAVTEALAVGARERAPS